VVWAASDVTALMALISFEKGYRMLTHLIAAIFYKCARVRAAPMLTHLITVCGVLLHCLLLCCCLVSSWRQLLILSVTVLLVSLGTQPAKRLLVTWYFVMLLTFVTIIDACLHCGKMLWSSCCELLVCFGARPAALCNMN
jgi:hypothetical protein